MELLHLPQWRVCATLLFMLLLIARINSEQNILNRMAQKGLTGSMTHDYEWGTAKDPGSSQAWDSLWIRAVPGASRDPISYAALSHEMEAAPYWGHRLEFKAIFGRKGLHLKDGAFGVMFVRVVSPDGRTIAFDNMKDRRIVGLSYFRSQQSVVLDVPGLPPDSCPAEGSIPAFIQAGFLLCGGLGFVDLSSASFDVVSGGTKAITGGPPPWVPPGIDML